MLIGTPSHCLVCGGKTLLNLGLSGTLAGWMTVSVANATREFRFLLVGRSFGRLTFVCFGIRSLAILFGPFSTGLNVLSMLFAVPLKDSIDSGSSCSRVTR
jgi:hypothetical protein